MFRYGFGLAMDEWLKNGRTDGKTYNEYKAARRLFRDEDFGVPDLDSEPTEEELRFCETH